MAVLSQADEHVISITEIRTSLQSSSRSVRIETDFVCKSIATISVLLRRGERVKFKLDAT